MKKITLFALILCLLLCAGCSWMDGNYVSVTPHVVSSDQNDDDSTRISSYSQLLGALTDLVDAGTEHGLFSLSNYPQERIPAEMELAIDYIMNTYPIGAYAVESMDYEYSSGSPRNILSVDITYRHGKTEIAQIQTVRGIDSAQKAIAAAMKQCDNALVLQITDYADTDFAQLAADFAADSPETVMETPQVNYEVYPRGGSIRVVEIFFSYQTSRDVLRSMQSNVLPIFSSAQLYISSNADDSVKYQQLYAFLTERFDYTFETSITPSYSLLCHGVGDSRAFARVYAAMCRQVGLECMVVSGTRNGESHFWNIVRESDTYYHVDLLRCIRDGGWAHRTDSEMTSYVWDYSAYPECGEKIAESQPPMQ